MVFKSQLATQASFINMMNKEPRILHISCHGLTRERTNHMTGAKEADSFLLFETPEGEGELVSSSKLNKLISKHIVSLDVVYVAAC